MFPWLAECYAWFTDKEIRPFLGAFAAVLAAMTIQPGSWFKPLRALRRVVQVFVVWLVLAFLLGLIPFANGEGYGSGGRGQGGTGRESGAGPGEHPGILTSRPGVLVIEGDFPVGLSPNVVLRIEFVPLAMALNTARDFACDVHVRATSQLVQIRAGTMPEFEAELRRLFREVPIPEGVRNPMVSIRQTPFPGTGVLRKIESLVREALPRLGLQRDE